MGDRVGLGLGYLLAQQLVAAGEDVVDVPPTLSARVRVLGSGKAQKNDPNDALSTAIAALRGRRLRPVRVDDHAAILRMLGDRHHDLTSLRTQAVCRLHAQLAALIPGGVAGELTAERARAVIRTIRPVDGVVTERRRQTADLICNVPPVSTSRSRTSSSELAWLSRPPTRLSWSSTGSGPSSLRSSWATPAR